MPQIKKNREQEKALDTITKNLRTLNTINEYLENAGQRDIFIGMSVPSEKKPVLLKINDEKGKPKVVAVLRGKHASLVKEIKALASKYDIELSDDEERILKGHLNKESEKTEAEDEEDTEEINNESEFEPESDAESESETETEYSAEYTQN